MTLSSASIRVRISIAFGLLALLSFVYIRALAAGYGAGTIRSYAHPFHDVLSDLLLFFSITCLLACVMPMFRSTAGWHRVVACCFLFLPLCIVAHFIVWLIRLYA
jgi:hypothetical protein